MQNTGVKLYIGIADYRSAEAADTESVWYGSDEIVRQMKMIDTTGKAAGTVHFRYGSVANSQALSDAVKRHFATVPDAPVQPGTPSEQPEKEPGVDAGTLFDIFSLFLYSVTHE